MRREFTDEERARAAELLKTWTFPEDPDPGDYGGMILGEVLSWFLLGSRGAERPDLDEDKESPEKPA